ncbi:MAG: DEAD/DEAH box helicase, partial [Myxococcota bacterium]|nr:DEAD/DEAH box helicase [Myxococcota bacterium]
MRRFDAGRDGETIFVPPPTESTLPEKWATIIASYLGDHTLRPIQFKALHQFRILESRRNLVVCSPTNSGKSLIGHLLLLQEAQKGRRAILLVPLRALAQEKRRELSTLFRKLQDVLDSPPPSIEISTGDYRLEGCSYTDPPPETGEVIIATPERLDSIIRNPDHEQWVRSIGTVVIDEAHLVGNKRRGSTLEFLIATLLSLNTPPRLSLLSATIGNPERLRDWLKPCDLILDTHRVPPLQKNVLVLEESENPDAFLSVEVRKVLSDCEHAVLIFVYKRTQTKKLADFLSKQLQQNVLYYHAGLSTSHRESIRKTFLSGAAKCLVTTTALSMGMNLPATHVYIRDAVFHGFGTVSIGDLLQAMGRAGRGQKAGYAAVILRHNDPRNPRELARDLALGTTEPIRSAFEPIVHRSLKNGSDSMTPNHAILIGACLSRSGREGVRKDTLHSILKRTLASDTVRGNTSSAIAFLIEHCLAYAEKDRLFLTVLGRNGMRSMLPIPFITGVGQLFRDFFCIYPQDDALRQFSALDHLILIGLLFENTPTFGRYSQSLAQKIDAWHESQSINEKSYLFRKWIMGSSSTILELLGSLGIKVDYGKPEQSRKRAYLSVFSALILLERSRGTSCRNIERRWHIKHVASLEERWRDSAIWLLSGQANMLELPSFYYHLLETCA